MIQETSLFAYEALTPQLSDMQRIVYEALKQEPMTDRELKNKLGWEINSITGRRNELFEMGKIEKARKRPCRITGRTVIEWKIRNYL